jgi:peroxiredoxin
MIQHPKAARRSSVLRYLVTAGIFILGAGLIPWIATAQQNALYQAAPDLPPVISNYPAPQLAFLDLTGKPVSLDDYPGTVVLVNNWATWCPPCKAEMPELQEYYSAHAADDFVVVAIESGDPASGVTAFVQEYGLTFPIWLDPQGTALKIFNNPNLPSSYVINRKGNICLAWLGAVTGEMLELYVTPLIKENG